MSQFFYFIKTMIITLILVVLLQIDFHDRPLESYMMDWVASSPVIEPLRSLAHSSVQGIKESWSRLNGFIQSKLHMKSREKDQRSSFSFVRSKNYLFEQAKKLKEAQETKETIEVKNGAQPASAINDKSNKMDKKTPADSSVQ